jgi:hypothetical protein
MAAIVSLLISITMFVGCDNPVDEGGSTPATYTVTVVSEGTGATGGGNYAEGATVNINAGTAPAGKKFKNWTTADGVTFANANSAATTFTMPAKAVTVTANFETTAEATYKVTVVSEGTGATGGGDYAENATVTINAGTAPAGKQFKNWTTDDGVTFANADSAATTFTMPAKAVTVTANFVPTYTVTVVSEGTGATGGGNYAADATVTIYAGTAPEGKYFVNWTTTDDGVTFANADSATTTFTMPAKAVTVTAVFEDIPENTGSVDITIRTDVDFNGIPDPFPVLSKSGDPQTVSITVADHNDDTYDDVVWYIDGAEADSGLVDDGTLTLNAAALDWGPHYLTVVVKVGGLLYSKEVTFEVTR